MEIGAGEILDPHQDKHGHVIQRCRHVLRRKRDFGHRDAADVVPAWAVLGDVGVHLDRQRRDLALVE